jgi:hypothetical protein
MDTQKAYAKDVKPVENDTIKVTFASLQGFIAT